MGFFREVCENIKTFGIKKITSEMHRSAKSKMGKLISGIMLVVVCISAWIICASFNVGKVDVPYKGIWFREIIRFVLISIAAMSLIMYKSIIPYNKINFVPLFFIPFTALVLIVTGNSFTALNTKELIILETLFSIEFGIALRLLIELFTIIYVDAIEKIEREFLF